MKKEFKEIVAWQFYGHTAIGVLNDDYTDNYVSVAVNYFMDSNMQEGWLWYADDIHTDKGTTVRPATDEEIQTLIKALDEHNHSYEYDKETKMIFDKKFYEVNYKHDMGLNEYQEKAMTTCMESSNNFSYMFLNLVGEVGEFASKVAKHIRKNNAYIGGAENHLNPKCELEEWDNHEFELMKEAGDCLWQLSGLCTVMGWSLEDVAQQNLDKLAARKAVGTIDGNGDGIIREK